MRVFVDIVVGKYGEDPKKIDLDRHIEALDRQLERCKVGDIAILSDTQHILNEIRSQLPE